jgi:DNA-binding transcriptional regulator YhcF (GntR family)
MRRIWISRRGSIPVREQISAQILFGILGRGIEPSERLPSVRDLARRINVHPNTVSAAYRDLAARGWVKQKPGSGVFVSDTQTGEKGEGIDSFVRSWIDEGLTRGFSLDSLSAAFEKAVRKEIWPRAEHRRLLVVHPDRHFACILAAEIREAVKCEVIGACTGEAPLVPEFETFLLLTTTSGAAAVSPLSPEGYHLIPLKSIEELVGRMAAPGSPVLVGVVSRSEVILKWASMLIPALNVRGSDLLRCNPEKLNWRRGLAACDVIVADILAARELSRTIPPVVLRLIPDSFLQEVGRLVTAKRV